MDHNQLNETEHRQDPTLVFKHINPQLTALTEPDYTQILSWTLLTAMG